MLHRADRRNFISFESKVHWVISAGVHVWLDESSRTVTSASPHPDLLRLDVPAGPAPAEALPSFEWWRYSQKASMMARMRCRNDDLLYLDAAVDRNGYGS